jgi:hypothetical protein
MTDQASRKTEAIISPSKKTNGAGKDIENKRK